jgi:hypothetical protein
LDDGTLWAENTPSLYKEFSKVNNKTNLTCEKDLKRNLITEDVKMVDE